jgi:hypothetical protein
VTDAALPLLALISAGDLVRVALALAAAVVLLKVGMSILGGFARPVPPPPDPGELRKVRLTYRCAVCATEVRMTMANDEVPEPPRHCMEDMDLVTPVDDL